MTTPIPQPRTIPFLGNTRDLDKDVPLKSFMLLAKKYGEIYQLDIFGRHLLNVNTYALCAEVSDEKRFGKGLNSAMLQVRNLLGDALFTAHDHEGDWDTAHRLLMPAFGTSNVKNMLEDMRDISDQLLAKWERFGPDTIIDPSNDFTRTALDAIAFCTMSYRLNSFYTATQPPFAQAMVDFLKESFLRSNRPAVVQALMPGAAAKYEQDMNTMREVAAQIVAERKAHPTTRKDLLETMLSTKDPKTGKGLPEDNIGRNLLTFLIAGHETSSGTMTFTIYYLLKNPESMRKLRAEVDEVLQGRPVQYEDFSKLPYLTAVMRETLRLAPPASTRSARALEDTTLGEGKYAVPAETPITLHAWAIHRDPLVWGEDANEFHPERMMDGKFQALPPNAWQPFGFGARGCIGRPFAWQEISLVIVSVIQKFDLTLVDPSYTLEVKQALTVKPKDLLIRAALRTDGPRFVATPSSVLMQTRGAGHAPDSIPTTQSHSSGKTPLYVLYGSNTGTSEGFAQRIANDASSHGFSPSIGTLDSASGHLPTDGPCIIITASFEGFPPDNAVHFIDWLQNLTGEELQGVRYAVFGCGNSEWAQTFQRVPKLCDALIEKRGGQRLLPRGVGDASKGEFFQVFDDFEAKLWDELSKIYSLEATASTGLTVTVLDTGMERPSTLRQSVTGLGKVIENRVLTKPGHPVKRHIEFELPEGMTYNAGDYLSVLPHNPAQDVRRVLAYFKLYEEQHVTVSSDGPTSLPVNQSVSLFEILSGYVELSQPATTQDIETLLHATTSESTRAALQVLKDDYQKQVIPKRISVLDILERHSSDIDISLSVFLRMLPPMRVRQYSISSSPIWNPQHVTLTISVIEAPAVSRNAGTFFGVASTYLSQLIEGEHLQISVRPSAVHFHPPQDPTTPMVMFCAGSGFAPMRGFLQERALQKASGREVGTTLLFFGCRYPDADYLYGDSDLAEWIKLGVVDVRPAFSRDSGKSEGCKYVQDRVWHDRKDVKAANIAGAKFFTCGSGQIAKGIKDKLLEILESEGSLTREEAVLRFDAISKDRYVTDIFD